MADDGALDAAAAAAHRKKEQEMKLFALRNKRNLARKINKDEVLAETMGEKLGKAEGHEEYVARRRELEREADVAAGVGVAAAVDKEKERLLNTTGLDNDFERRKKAKTEKRQGFSWDIHNEESKYRSYKKRVSLLEKTAPLEEDYKKAKARSSDGLAGKVDELTYGEAPEVPEERMKLLLGDLKQRKEDKKKFKRHRPEYDDEDVAYINNDNRQFVKKIDRAYGKYTAKIAEALEKGTS